MIGQSLLLLADVQLLDIIDEFLLQPVLVVVDLRDLFQAFDDRLFDLRHAALLEGLDRLQQCLDIVDLLVELLLQCGTFLTAESLQVSKSSLNTRTYGRPLLVTEFLFLRFPESVGQTQQHIVPVLRLRNAGFGRDRFDLLIVRLYNLGVDGHTGLCVVFLNPNREVHFATDERFGNHLSDLHLLFAVDGSDACGKVEGLAVERLHLNVYLLGLKGHCSAAIACH